MVKSNINYLYIEEFAKCLILSKKLNILFLINFMNSKC